jgi:hypothetical protein|tara:strand:- start:4807 stop:5058 length:252 start_codon:yes stop_codon:yes gene_type:complete
MKYKVKKRAVLLYPDGSVRGELGYVIDTDLSHDREAFAAQPEIFVRAERTATVSPVLVSKFVAEPAPKKAKKKTTKKKTKKKT